MNCNRAGARTQCIFSFLLVVLGSKCYEATPASKSRLEIDRSLAHIIANPHGRSTFPAMADCGAEQNGGAEGPRNSMRSGTWRCPPCDFFFEKIFGYIL